MYLIDIEEKKSIATKRTDLYFLFLDENANEQHRVILNDVDRTSWDYVRNDIITFLNSDLDCEWCWDRVDNVLYIFDCGARLMVKAIAAESIFHIREDWE